MLLSWRRLKSFGPLVVVAAIAGCGGSDPAPPVPGAPAGATAPGFPTSLSALARAPRTDTGRMAQATQDGGYAIDPTDRAQVLLFYRTVYASSRQAKIGWTGNIGNCDAGDTAPEFRAAELRRINWFRAMAGVPAGVQLDATYNAKAQQAALLMAANMALSHTPPTTWNCYNATAAEAALHSDLALGRNGADGIGEAYMKDAGANNPVVGHRRWILYPQTQFMGAGDVEGSVKANALWVQDDNIRAARPAVRDDYVAWPPRGYTPYTTVYPRWSFSYPQADFSGATVSMTENGVPIATRAETPVNGYGENTLVWFPGTYTDGMSWARPAGDTAYQVTVSNVIVGGVARSFTYTATVIDPNGEAATPIEIAGNATLAPGQVGSYSFGTVPGASSYEWRTLGTSAYAFDDGAESGAGNFTVTSTGSYPVVTTDAAASGASSFHFAHPTMADQQIVLKQPLAVNASSQLSFASRLGLSSAAQFALVEVSVDEGSSWQVVFEQAGQQSATTTTFGETTFTTRTVSLAAYAGRTVLLRWRYALVPIASWYGQTSAGIGWYIDDIRLTNVSAANANPATPLAGTSFQVLAGTGSFALQARAGMYGYFSEWGAVKAVTVSQATGAECLFNWAEANVPSLFSPATTSLTAAPYVFRFYAATGVYLGVSSQDDHVYWLAGGQLHDAGAKAGWLATAGCQP